MEQELTVEDQVIDIVRRAHVCDLEEVMRQCANLTWNINLPETAERSANQHPFPSY
jgi:hypothetical protein